MTLTKPTAIYSASTLRILCPYMGSTTPSTHYILEMAQCCAAHFFLNKPWFHDNDVSVTEMLQDLKWLTLQTQCKYIYYAAASCSYKYYMATW